MSAAVPFTWRLFQRSPTSRSLVKASPYTMADKFDEVTQKELATFLEKEQALAKVQSSVHQLTGVCWEKCVTGTPGRSFSRNEQSCLANCVDRFLDTSLYMVKEIQEKVFEH